MRSNTKIITLIFIAILAVKGAEAGPAGPKLALQDFLNLVEQKNGNFRSLKSSREAVVARRIVGDAELATVLTAKYGESKSKRPQIFGPMTISGTEGKEVSLELAKKFSTGTNVELKGSVTESKSFIDAAQPPASPTTSNTVGAMGVSISQSLWKNFFGKSTDLRREREEFVEKAESGGLDVSQRKILIEAEAAFWDHVYLIEELRQRVDSLERARGLQVWMKRRVGNGIGDRTDLIGTDALIAGHEFHLLSTQDELAASTRKIRDLLEMAENEPAPELIGKLDGVRDISTQVEGEFGSNKAQAQVVSYEAYLSSLQARAKAVGAQEAVEGYKPDLVLTGSYSTNSVDTSMSGAAQDISNTRIPSTSVGISFKYMLDSDIKNAGRDVAKVEALSAKQIQERKFLESRAAWEEILRRHKEMTAKVKLAERSSRLRLEKADAEKEKLSKGRSTTSMVVQAEEDAADGRLNLAKIQAEQRKLEAQGRMFIRLSEEK